MFLFQTGNTSLILGTGILLYTLMNFFIKGYYSYKYKKEHKYMSIIKLMQTILIVFMGL